MSKSYIPPTLYQIKAAPSVELPPSLLVFPFGQMSHGSSAIDELEGSANFSWSDTSTLQVELWRLLGFSSWHVNSTQPVGFWRRNGSSRSF